jgi:hypothetical protein
MTNIDAALARLREMPVHPGLESIDAAVMAEMAARAATVPLSGAMLGFAATAALLIGIAGSVIQPAPVRAAGVAPFGAPAALAPSTLLGSSE